MSQYGATKVAAESLRAQINLQCKLAMLRRENLKIQYENKIFKSKQTWSRKGAT
jgi:hypothetical protein